MTKKQLRGLVDCLANVCTFNTASDYSLSIEETSFEDYMITVLKETPITFHGHDCMEVLVRDDNIVDCTCCDLCCYTDFEDWIDAQATCMDVHGCTTDARCYFITKPL